MNKHLTLFLTFTFFCITAFSSSPGLIWHATYGTSTDNQQALVMAIDNYDNMFATGYVNFGNGGNILVNRYDGVGNLMWNRLYNNAYSATSADKPVAIFPDDQAGVTVVGYVNKQSITTHILHYDPTGYLNSDYAIGDSSTGSKTAPIAVIYDGALSFYMIGQLYNVSKVFKTDNSGNIVWSVPLHNSYNDQAGSISFDPNGNLIVAVFDSILPQVVIHRYNASTGSELAGFNSGVDSLSTTGNPIKMQVDRNSNILLAGVGLDSSGHIQYVVHTFDITGMLLWKATCNSTKGYSNQINSFLLDHNGDVLISGPYTDYADTLQFGGVNKISGDSGNVLWLAIDSQFLVNDAVTQIDQYSNVYFGVTRTPSTISPLYSNFSFSQLTPDSGLVNWNRSFDNSADNTGLIVQVNNFGDVFFVTSSPTDTSSAWFLGRIGNNAADSTGTGIVSINEENDLSIYPNPFSNSTNIRFTTTESESISLELYDVTGRLLQQQNLQSVAGTNAVQFKTNVASGAYLVKLNGANNSSVRQVIIY